MLLTLLLVACPATGKSRVEIMQSGGYPELRVDGKAFFVYGAEFAYQSTPPADWNSILADFKSMGINTVRLEVRREWHEAGRGNFDFRGRTMPGRNLLGLVKQLAAMRLEASLTVTLDPQSTDLRSWVRALSRQVVLAHSAQSGGNIIWIELDSRGRSADRNQSSRRAPATGDRIAAVVRKTKAWMVAEGVTLPFATEGTSGETVSAIDAAPASSLRPAHAHGAESNNAGETDPQFWFQGLGSAPVDGVTNDGAGRLEREADLLATHHLFPPIISRLQIDPGVDGGTAAVPSGFEDFFLLSRLLVRKKVRGFHLLPATEVRHGTAPAAAALARGGREIPQLHRNGMFLTELGSWIASAHEDADLGLGYLGNGYDSVSPRQVRALLHSALRFQEFCARRNFSTTWIDVAREPMQNLARHRVLVIPQQVLADASLQTGIVPKLRDYIRTGGSLVFTGSWPSPKTFGIDPEMDTPLRWSSVADSLVPVFKNLDPWQQIIGRHDAETATTGMRQSLGYGQLILYGLNFFESPEDEMRRGGDAEATDAGDLPSTDADANFSALISASRFRQKLFMRRVDSVRVSLLDSNSGSGRMICLVNFSDKPRETGSLQVIADDGAWSLPSIHIPPHDAQFLALDMPLPNGDFLLHTTTEFLGQTREGYLRFYAPRPANGALSAAGRLSPLNFDIPVATRPDGIITLQVIAAAQRKAQVVVIQE